MTLLAALARLEAATAGRAVPLSRVRHRRLSSTPLVIVPLTLAGDPAAPVAVATGITRGRLQLLTVPQPRNREQRLQLLTRLAQTVLQYITDRQQSTESVAATGTQPARTRYTQAPQVLVPNKAARDYIGLLGRSVRFERADGPYAVDPAVPALGKWLTWLADNSDEPGSALLADLTGFLSEHWATGQSPLEDANLAAQLAWIDPPPGMSSLQAALAAEDPVQCPPAGPATDPGFDRAVLGPLIHEYDRYSVAGNSTGTSRVTAEIEDAFHEQIEPAWDAAWHAIALLRGLPEAPAAARRWTDDRDRFTRYSNYLASDGRPQPRRDAPAAAASRLSRLERAQAAYEAQRALEDPYVFAELRTTGEAFTGQVVSAQPTRKVPGGKGRLLLRPTFTVQTTDPVRIRTETVLTCLSYPKLKAKITQVTRTGELADVVLEMSGGMGRGSVPAPGAVPAPGEQVSCTADPGYWTPPQFPPPDKTPWTHGGPRLRPDAELAQEPRP